MSNSGRNADTRGSTSEATRQRNLALMLTEVHHAGALSRAELTKRSGLNRSTVGALMTELRDLEVAVETESVADGTAGRPSIMVSPHQSVVALAVNPDVLGLNLAWVGLGGRVVASETILTPEPVTPDDVVTLTHDFVGRAGAVLPPDARVAGVGVAVPGLVDSRDSSVRSAIAMGWRDVGIGELLEEELALPVSVANDATAGTLAEAIFGAGVGYCHVVYLNGSLAGLGGGVISGGRVLEGAHGLGTELGHLPVPGDGLRCPCGRRGCLETEVNVQRIWEVLGENVLALDDLDFIYATEQTPRLDAELDRQADALAAGIASIAMVVDPERVIFGGHVGCLLEVRHDRILAGVQALAHGPLGTEFSLVRNALRDRIMPIGAAELAFAALLRDPAHAPLFSLAPESRRSSRQSEPR